MGLGDAGGDWRGCGWELRSQGPLIQFGEKLSLDFCDGLSVQGCDFRRLGLADSGFRLLGKEGAVSLGVGVTLGHRGCDAGGPWIGGFSVGSYGICWWLSAAGAMRGEALGCLFLESNRGCGFRFRPDFVQR